MNIRAAGKKISELQSTIMAYSQPEKHIKSSTSHGQMERSEQFLLPSHFMSPQDCQALFDLVTPHLAFLHIHKNSIFFGKQMLLRTMPFKVESSLLSTEPSAAPAQWGSIQRGANHGAATSPRFAAGCSPLGATVFPIQ